MVGKEKANELAIGVMSINLKCSLLNHSPSVNHDRTHDKYRLVFRSDVCDNEKQDTYAIRLFANPKADDQPKLVACHRREFLHNALLIF